LTRRERHPDDSFIFIACDGIWDVFTSAEAATYIREVGEELKEDDPAHRLLEAMFDDIIAEDIDD
jgi:serine/threonine protein phosphatase PrpC